MDDLISRQAAIDALLGITAMRNTIPLDSAIFNIKKLPSAEPDRKWIPVTEALPEDMDRLLATIVRTNGEKRVRSGHYYKGLFMMDNGDTWNETDKEILAWMPLVEPWRGE